MRRKALTAPTLTGPLLWVALLCAAVGALAASAQDRPCGTCDSTGRVAFEFDKSAIALEEGTDRCSEFVVDAEANHGIDFRPCPRCKSPSLREAAEKEYQRLREDQLQWLEERRAIDQFLADRRLKLMHCRTEHLDVCWSVPKVKVGRKTIRQHEAMHLYAERIEKAYAGYLEQFELSHMGSQNGVRHLVMIFDMARHSSKAMPEYTGIGSSDASSGAKLMGVKSVFVTWWDKTKNKDDEKFHEYVLHNMVHLFLAANFNYVWLGQKNGWADAGFSHYHTVRLFGLARTHCYQEQDELSGWEMDEWAPTVRARVSSGSFPPFASVLDQHIETLDADQHLFAWSWVEYLIEAHEPAQWIAFVHRLKNKAKVRDALKEVYGYSTLQFVERWKEHVLDTYPSR